MTTNTTEQIHACDLLKYDSQYLRLVYPGTGYQRWVLFGAPKGEYLGSDPVRLQMVCFCPCCGLDLRKDLNWRVPGRPTFNELVAKVQAAAL